MPHASNADRARMHAALTPTTEDAVLISLARPPAMSSGQRSGTPIVVATDVPFKLWPAAGGSGEQRLLQAIPDAAGARMDMAGMVPSTTDIRHGDEVRLDTRTFKVVGVGRWEATTAVALSEVKPK